MALEPSGADAGSPAENAALALALSAYLRRANNEAVEPLTQFIAAYPSSKWNGSLRLNLGIVYRLTCRFTKALNEFEAAWALLKEDHSPTACALGDRALAELAELNARFGRQERLRALFGETKARVLCGGAAERLVRAKEGLWGMENHPESSFLCGPYALSAMCSSLKIPSAFPAENPLARSTSDGTSLAQNLALSKAMGASLQMAKRSKGAALIVPSLVHWRVGHFAALIRDKDDRALVRDRTYHYDQWVEKNVLDDEATGYFLVPEGKLPEGWMGVGDLEGGAVWGKGDVGGGSSDDLTTNDEMMSKDCPPKGMANYNVHALNISLTVSDIPVGYQPAYGPGVEFRLTYLQREANQPQNPNFSNLGRKWSHGWMAYLKDDPSNEDGDVFLVAAGGGQQTYTDYDAATSTYGLHYKSGTKLVRTSTSLIKYERHFPDGSKEVFAQADGLTTFPRKIFITERTDAFGNKITFSYDATLRLTLVTDALGQATTLSYEDAANPLRITKVTDPFSRFASLEYHPDGMLKKITDVVGITSEFTYRPGDFMTSLITGYGTTTFDGGEYANKSRWLEVTDPLGQKERAEFHNKLLAAGAGLGVAADAADYAEVTVLGQAPLPATSYNVNSLEYRNSYFWDKKAMTEAPGRYGKASIYHWLHKNATIGLSGGIVANVLESIKSPLVGRVWYRYPGQSDPIYFTGITIASPSEVVRVVEAETSTPAVPVYAVEKSLFTYDLATGNVTLASDPKGRVTRYTFAANGQDLTLVEQKNGTAYEDLAAYTYTNTANPVSKHQPLTIKKGGETTTFTYNSNGQIKTGSNALGEVTTFNYFTTAPYAGYLQNIDGPITGAGAGDTVSFTYDGNRNIETVTRSDGYTVTFETDNLDRVTKVTHPDNTSSEITYEMLSVAWLRDRQGRWSRNWFDGLGRTVATMDPLDQVTQYEWCACGSLRAMLDPALRKTMWFRDIAGRVTKKLYEDGQTQKQLELNTYQPYSGRAETFTDPDGRVTRQSYTVDGMVAKREYSGTGLPAIAETFVYGASYRRLDSMTDANGLTNYTYAAITNTTGNGEGQVRIMATDVNPASATAANKRYFARFLYDALGRVDIRQRSTSAAGTTNTAEDDYTYDGLGRISRVVNPLGRFDAYFEGNTGRVDRVGYRPSATGALSTEKTIVDFTYDSVTNDSRLLSMTNKNFAATQAQLSKFDYTYRLDGIIKTWKQQQSAVDAGAERQWTFGYDNGDQLSSAILRNPTTQAITKTMGYRFDKSGNRSLEQRDGVAQRGLFNAVNQVTTLGGGLPDRVLVAGKTNEPATVNVGGQPATAFADGSFRAWVTPTGATTSVPVSATDGNGNVNNKTLSFTVTPEAAKTFTYDKAGNLTADGVRTYEWDQAGRLKKVTLLSTGAVTEWVYDALGNRRQEKLNGTVIKRWVYCGMKPCEERDAAGAVTKRFYAQGFSTVSGATVTDYFYTRDHLGSIREVFNAAGVLKAAYDYDPYGRRSDNAVTTAPLESDFGFTGHYYHAATKLVLSPTRAYDPETGRWISRDPAGEAGGLNLYAYCEGDPVNKLDRMGAWPDWSKLADAAGGWLSDLRTSGDSGGEDWIADGAFHTLIDLAEGVTDALRFGESAGAVSADPCAGWRDYAAAGVEELGRGAQLVGAGAATAKGFQAAAKGLKVAKCKLLKGGCFVAGTQIATAEGARSIESLRVGDRVSTTDGESATVVDPATWRKVTLQMVSPEDGAVLIDIELLRSQSWLEASGATRESKIWLQMEEMGLRGWADVKRIEPCPKIKAGKGRVVLATMTHDKAEVLEVKFRDQSSLKLTAGHRLYSQTLGDWLPAELLQPGESLKTATGTATVAAIIPQKGGNRVFNLEVESEHCYFAGDAKVLSHNSGLCPPNMSPPGAGRRGAFNEAKRQSGIPTSQQPKVTQKNTDKRGNSQPGRQYDFDDGKGGVKTIRDDSGGHRFPDDPTQNRGPHFNDPAGNHYDY